MFLGCFKDVSRKIEVCFNGVLSGFQGNLTEGCSESPLRGIQGSFKVYKRSLKGVSRQFQRCFNKVSSVFKEIVKCVSSKFL